MDWNYIVPNQCNNGNVGAPIIQNEWNWINNAITTIAIPFNQNQVNSILGASTDPIPETFSWRGLPGIEPGGIRNQGLCGSCFTFSVASTIGDRYAIKYKLQIPPLPSPVWLLSNVNRSNVTGNQNSCSGGVPQLLCKWIENNFIKAESCWPYGILKDHEKISPSPLNALQDTCCYDCCQNQNASLKFYIKPGSTHPVVSFNQDGSIDINNTILAIQKEIIMNGPVVGTYDVYSDFNDYWRSLSPSNKNAYQRSPNASYAGGHAIVITGWTVLNGVKCWEIRNSWGNTGDNGYGYIAMYTNENSTVGLDIPIKMGAQYRGGVTTFEAWNNDTTTFGGEGGSGFILFRTPAATITTIIVLLLIIIIILAIVL